MGASTAVAQPATIPAMQSAADIVENPKLFQWIQHFSAGVLIAICVVGIATWNVSLFSHFGIAFDGGPTAFLIALICLIASIKEVGPDVIAGAYCLGRALVRLDPGPHFLPPILTRLRTEPRPVQEFQCPEEPERVQKGEDKIPLEKGMVRPIRAVTRAPKQNETGILDVQMTLEPSFVVQYAITDIFDFVANYGSSENVQKQLRDIGETTLAEELSRCTPASFIRKLPKINRKLVEEIRKRFLHSGINIISVRLVSPDITHEVGKELANIPIARAQAQQAEIKSVGERTRLTNVGEGTANAKLSLLRAQAKGQKEIKEALGITDGNVVIAAEAVSGLSDKTDVLILGQGGMRDAMSLVKGAQSAFNMGKGKGAQP